MLKYVMASHVRSSMTDLAGGFSTLYAGNGGGASVSPPFLMFAKFPYTARFGWKENGTKYYYFLS